MRNRINSFKFRFLRDEFNKNVAILSGGIALSQLIPVLVSPVLTRLYSPQDFGVLALFVSITTILSVIANGRYELAVMLPEKDDDAINVAAIAFIVNVIFSFFCLFLIISLRTHLLRILKMESLGIWAYFIPLTSFFIALFNLLNYTNNRFKLYKDIAKSNIYKSISNALIKLTLGFFKTGAGGLIIGQIISQFVANSKLFDNIKKTGLIASLSLRKIKELAKLYSNFPTFSLLAGLINTLAYQLTNILVGSFYGESTLGHYYLSQMILGLPLSYIGTAVSQVFYQHAASELKANSTIKFTFKSTLKKLFYIGIPVFTLIFILSIPVFTFVFGQKWYDAGKYTMYLTPLYCIRFIAIPFTLIPMIFKKNQIDFLFQTGIVTITIATILLNRASVERFLLFYSGLLTVYYLSYILLLKVMFVERKFGTSQE